MVSSANSLMLLLIEAGMSLMYIETGSAQARIPAAPQTIHGRHQTVRRRGPHSVIYRKKDLIHAITVVLYPVDRASAEAFDGQLYQKPC